MPDVRDSDKTIGEISDEVAEIWDRKIDKANANKPQDREDSERLERLMRELHTRIPHSKKSAPDE